MRQYDSGTFGFKLLLSLRGSVFPRAFIIAVPNVVLTVLLSFLLPLNLETAENQKRAFTFWTGFNFVLGFLISFRNQKAYSRWWEGGTLLQQVRGEWFNAYSSLIAFCTHDPKKEQAVEEFGHLLARLISLLYCSALQQVSPSRNKPFEVMSTEGMCEDSLRFLYEQQDKVEVILQWTQKLIVEKMNEGILPIPAPILSRVFQELSRGVVNHQNARKIAEFPFPFPYAQTNTLMLLIHWIMCPVFSALLLDRVWAAILSFITVFVFWCTRFISTDLENPYGDKENQLPLAQMQQDLNRSLFTLLKKRAQIPPTFDFNPAVHCTMNVQFSMERRATLLNSEQMSEEIKASTEESSSHINLSMRNDPRRMSSMVVRAKSLLSWGGPVKGSRRMGYRRQESSVNESRKDQQQFHGRISEASAESTTSMTWNVVPSIISTGEESCASSTAAQYLRVNNSLAWGAQSSTLQVPGSSSSTAQDPRANTSAWRSESSFQSDVCSTTAQDLRSNNLAWGAPKTEKEHGLWDGRVAAGSTQLEKSVKSDNRLLLNSVPNDARQRGAEGRDNQLSLEDC